MAASYEACERGWRKGCAPDVFGLEPAHKVSALADDVRDGEHAKHGEDGGNGDEVGNDDDLAAHGGGLYDAGHAHGLL